MLIDFCLFGIKTKRDRKTIWEAIASFPENGSKSINEKRQKQSQGETEGERHYRDTFYWTQQIPGVANEAGRHQGHHQATIVITENEG